MPYYSKCRAIEMKKAGIKVPKKYIIDNGEDCDNAMARNEVAGSQTSDRLAKLGLEKLNF